MSYKVTAERSQARPNLHTADSGFYVTLICNHIFKHVALRLYYCTQKQTATADMTYNAGLRKKGTHILTHVSLTVTVNSLPHWHRLMMQLSVTLKI